MKFEVTTMLPVHTTAVKRRLNCCPACGYLYTVVGCQLNEVIAFTATEEDDDMRQITDLHEYVSKIIKQEVKLSSMVCPIWRVQKHGSKAIKTRNFVYHDLKVRFI